MDGLELRGGNSAISGGWCFTIDDENSAVSSVGLEFVVSDSLPRRRGRNVMDSGIFFDGLKVIGEVAGASRDSGREIIGKLFGRKGEPVSDIVCLRDAKR